MIISNNCLGGFIYKNNNKIYDNPFMWNRIYIKDFCYLIEHFEEIDFTKFEIKKKSDFYNKYDIDKVDNLPVVFLNNKIPIFFNHICNINRKNKIIDAITHIYVEDPIKYCKDCWEKRVKRMTNKFCVVYMINLDRRNESIYDIVKLIEICKKKKIKLYLFSNLDILKEFKNEYNEIICDKFIDEKSVYEISRRYNDMLLKNI